MKQIIETQVCNIEQMKHLKELGVDTSNASIYWTFPSSPDYKTKIELVGINGNLKAYEDREYGIGAFALQDMLKIMPVLYPTMEGEKRVLVKDRRIDSGCHYQPTIFHSEDGWFCSYFDSDCLMDERTSSGYNNPLNAAYDMLCWLYENRYL